MCYFTPLEWTGLRIIFNVAYRLFRDVYPDRPSGLSSSFCQWVMPFLAGARFGLFIELSDGFLVQLIGIRSTL